MESVYDPLRRKSVAATPEERVRQWFIDVLRDACGCPGHLMMSEAHFKFGEKRFRADILIYDRNAHPLAVVECKREDVSVDVLVAEQAMRYDIVLCVSWLILTNGGRTLVFHREEGSFKPFDHIPSFDEMICLQ